MTKRATDILLLIAAFVGLAFLFKLCGMDKLTAARLLSPAAGGAAGVLNRRGDRLAAAAMGGLVGIAVVYAVAPAGTVATCLLGGAVAGGTAAVVLAAQSQQPDRG